MIGLVIGGAPTVWEELRAARAMVGDRAHLLIATNHAGRFFEDDIDAWATLHPECFEGWRQERADRGLNTDYRALLFIRRHRIPGTEAYPQTWGQSSGLFAAELALSVLGCRAVILCGVPLDTKAGHFHDPGDWPIADRYREGALIAKAQGLQVRSMGGWTSEVLGRPNADWIKSLRLRRAKPRARRARKPKESAMRIRLYRTRSFTPPEERRITVKYLAGEEYTVKRTWGEAMVADGDAQEVDPPKREPLHHDGDGRKGGAKPQTYA